MVEWTRENQQIRLKKIRQIRRKNFRRVANYRREEVSFTKE